MMIHSSKFWSGMIVFQLAFGLTIFALTRQHYLHESELINTHRESGPMTEWPEPGEEGELADLISAFPGTAAINDPLELSFQADEAFGQQQFTRAAELYERLLLVQPGNADTYNNLGLTLHYLGRSGEALTVLNEGVTVDPGYQRIWLTLGFVNSQTGNLEQARSALTRAVELDPDSDIGQSAAHMLDAL